MDGITNNMSYFSHASPLVNNILIYYYLRTHVNHAEYLTYKLLLNRHMQKNGCLIIIAKENEFKSSLIFI